MLRIGDGIWTVEGFMSVPECSEHIERSEAIGYEDASVVTAGVARRLEGVRNNARVILDDHALAEELWTRLCPLLPPIFRGRQAIGLNERFRYYRYDPGERFAPHADAPFRRDNGEKSQLTFMVYLSDGAEGGETEFDGLLVTPRRGMALVFDHALLHEGAAVRSGRKYVLRTDVMYGRVGEIRG